MADFWEQFRNSVLAATTSADVATRIYQKVATTRVMGAAVVRPAYYVGHVSELMRDFVNHVERLLNTSEDNPAALLRSIAFLRECCRSLKSDIMQVADPLERLVRMIEDLLEKEEQAALEDGNLLKLEDDASLPLDDEEGGEEALLDAEMEIDRESLFSQRDALSESLRVKFRDALVSEAVVNDVADVISEVYLECVQFARELARLDVAPDEDIATVMSIVMDLQFGLDVQLRNLLMEDIDTSDLEPAYELGFFTWTAHLMKDLLTRAQAVKPA